MGGAAWALGLMSGTSRDGVDAALVRSDGEAHVEPGAVLSRPYAPGFRARLSAAVQGTGEVAAVARELTDLHAEAVEALLAEGGVPRGEVRVIGFHGHTVHHDPARGVSRQIGDGARLARLTGIDVVDDFRAADVAAGGQGAPLAPLYHAALAGDLARPLAVLNLGGVANVTWLGADGRLIAFDTGPGNALIDDLVFRRTGRPFDAGGALAAAGRVDPAVLARLLDHPYFETPPPKSLDRDSFDTAPTAGLGVEDAAATLAAFTARAVQAALTHLPAAPRCWIVAGGGRHNPALMAALQRALGVPVTPVEDVGWNGDALEAQAFAYLAVRALRGLALSLPETTGVPAPMPGGRLHRAA